MVKNISVIIVLTFCTFHLNDFCNAQTKFSADVYASYLGGSGEEENPYIAVDRSGNVVIAGHTFSPDFPVTDNAFQKTFRGGSGFEPIDGFITKFNPDMTKIIFSTYLGGTGSDAIQAVAVDSLGNIYVTGITSSPDFPVTANAYNASYTGGMEVFLTKVSPDGNMLYSTYIGGGSAYGISVIDTSTVCITGNTGSTNFPLKSAYSNSIKGGSDLFLSEFNLLNNSFIFSTFFGGSGDELPKDIAVDKSGNIYVCGYTKSSDFPIKNAFDPIYGGKEDGFIIKFSKEGNLIYSSFVGGTEGDVLSGIDVNENGEVYFIGGSLSTGLACSVNAFSNTKKTDSDIILGKVNSSGDSLLYFSYFGGNNADNLWYNVGYPQCDGKIHFIGNENIVITCMTTSTDFKVSGNAYQKQLKDTSDIIVSVLNITRKDTLYFTYMGGSKSDYPFSLAVRNDSEIYVSGTSESTNFPTTSDAYSKTFQGGYNDEFFARLTLHPTITGINEKKETHPGELKLNQNYPNPFNPTTNIQYSLNLSSQVKLIVYNLLGQKIITLIDSYQNTGVHSIVWNGTDDSNREVSSGVYFYRLETNGSSIQRKMLLLR